MTLYHIKKDGTPGICHAEPGKCPLGGSNQHYSTWNEAQIAIDKQQIRLFLDLSAKKEELTTKLNEAKGIKKIHLKTALKIVESQLEGKDYNEEKRKKDEYRKAQQQKEMQIDNNAKIPSTLKEIPQIEILNVYQTGKYDKNSIKAYRGEVEAHSKTNSGMALYGLGRYTTTSKKYAKKYGTVRDANLNELPTNPIRFKTQQSFELWTQELAKKYNTDINHIYKYSDPSEIIKKMGYDGLTLGPKSDMIIVKY